MISLMLIFRNIKDLEDVLRFYVDNISPIMHRYPGVIGTDLHSVSELSPEYPQELDGVQLIFQTYFESYDTLSELLSSPDGMEIMELMERKDVGEYYIYWTRVKTFKNNVHLSKAVDQFSNRDIEDILSTLNNNKEEPSSD